VKRMLRTVGRDKNLHGLTRLCLTLEPASLVPKAEFREAGGGKRLIWLNPGAARPDFARARCATA
jgi:hypothetical protein